jgi:hypothetical protein
MARSYDLKLVICSIGGVPLSGFGEDGGITPEWSADLAETKKTADGHVIYSRTNDRECIVTVTLMQTSQAIPLLQAMLEAQHGDNLGIAPPVMIPVPFYLYDLSTGDLLTGDCVFLNRPAPAKEKTVGEVEFRVSLPSPKWAAGAANVAG